MTETAEPAYTVEKIPAIYDIFINGTPVSFRRMSGGMISYEDIKKIAYPNSGPDFTPSCVYSCKVGPIEYDGVIQPGQGTKLHRGLKISMIPTGEA